jgi:hypothetical protein
MAEPPPPNFLLEKPDDATLKKWFRITQCVTQQEGHCRTWSERHGLPRLAHTFMLNLRPIPSDYCGFLSKKPNCMVIWSIFIWATAQNMPLPPIIGEMNTKAKSSSKNADLYNFPGIYIWLYWGSRLNWETISLFFGSIEFALTNMI